MTSKYAGIALIGKSGAGKSEVADVIAREYVVRRFHPKQLFGEMITPILLRFGVSPDKVMEYVFGDLIESPLPLCPSLTARRLLQAAGGGFLQDLDRPCLAYDVLAPDWTGYPPVLVERVCYRREAEELRRRGYAIVRVLRPCAEDTADKHLSEVECDAVTPDFFLTNDGSLTNIRTATRELARNLGLAERRFGRVVLVLNGSPSSGKDTLTLLLQKYAEAAGMRFVFSSSIDPVKSMYAAAGLDLSRKTLEDRRLLALTKTALDEHGPFLTELMRRQVSDLRQQGEPFLFVTHIREPENILRFHASLGDRRTIAFRTVWVRRPGYPKHEASCKSDATSVDDADYDFLVDNAGTLHHLDGIAIRLLEAVVSGADGKLLYPNKTILERECEEADDDADY